MRVTKRVWAQQGYMLIEPADGHGHEYWIDHFGRIGVEHDNGSITWLQVQEHVQGMEIAGVADGMDTVMLAIDDVRTYGVLGRGTNLPGMKPLVLLLALVLSIAACGESPAGNGYGPPPPDVAFACHPPTPTAKLDVETCPGRQDAAICRWADPDITTADHVAGCIAMPGVVCVEECPPYVAPCVAPFADASITYGFCEPGATKGKALCEWMGDHPPYPLQLAGECQATAEIECVTACP